jgi:Tol biopolymer transport system component
VKLLLNRPATLDKSATAEVRARSSRRGSFAAAALIAALGATLVPATLYFLRAPEEKPAIRFQMTTPGILSGTPRLLEFPAISPDSQYVVYSALTDGKRAIWICPIGDEAQARPLAGTEDGRFPFWSPDSRYIAFYADRQLKKISIDSGPPTPLTENGSNPYGGTWNRDGIILFTGARGPKGPLGIVRISQPGGAVTPVGPHRDGFVEILPQFLPDGRHFLYVSVADRSGPGARAELYAGSLDGGTPVHIMSSGAIGVDSPGRYAALGYLLFVRDGILMAQRFDEKRLTLDGEPVPLARSAGPFSVSQQRLVYRPISAQGTAPSGTQQIVWIDRSGKPDPSIVMPVMPGFLGSVRLSPDGNRLALDRTTLDRNNVGNRDVWVMDLDRGIPDRQTFDAVDQFARWSPDGKQIVFASTQSGAWKMFIRSLVPGSTDQPLPSETPADAQDIPHDWSRNPEYIVFVRRPVHGGGADIWLKPMFGDGKPVQFVHSKKTFLHVEPRVSRNGRWLAYMTNESGRSEIVVHAFPDPDGFKTQVTADGGIYPTWGRNGHELYYLGLDGRLMAVSVKENGNKLDFGKPTVLVQSPLTVLEPNSNDLYDASADGSRFIFIANNNTSPTTPNDSDKLSVILNWTVTLPKK